MKEVSVAERWAASWLLDFAQTDLNKLDSGDREVLRLLIRQFPQSAYQVEEFRRYAPLRYMMATSSVPQDKRPLPFVANLLPTPSWKTLLGMQAKLKKALKTLEQGKPWGVPAVKFNLQSFLPPRPKEMPSCILKWHTGFLRDIFFAVTADVLVSTWHLIGNCNNSDCNVLFITAGKQRFCSNKCRNKTNWEKYKERHVGRSRDYRSEYEKKAKKLYSPNVKIVRKRKRSKKAGSTI